MSVEDVRDSFPKHRNPVKVIRDKCLDCVNGSSNEVALCPTEKCPLWPFRFGKNPYRSPVSEERRAASAERMRKLQAQKKTEGRDE